VKFNSFGTYNAHLRRQFYRHNTPFKYYTDFLHVYLVETFYESLLPKKFSFYFNNVHYNPYYVSRNFVFIRILNILNENKTHFWKKNNVSSRIITKAAIGFKKITQSFFVRVSFFTSPIKSIELVLGKKLLLCKQSFT
jgi:hypothetical protein